MRNKFEQKVAAQVGPGFAYEAKRLPYTLSHTYLPDFINEQTKEIIEAKGLFRSADRTKIKAIKKQYPEYSITIIFSDASKKIEKKSNTTYSQWCEKNGIQWKELKKGSK